jgi:hypothetical protein
VSPRSPPGPAGYIDRKGRFVIDAKYDEAFPFRGGIARVVLDGKIGYVDRSGTYIWPLTD